MSYLRKEWIAVGKAFLNIAVHSLNSIKNELENLTKKFVLDPITRKQREKAREKAESRQSEIDEEMVAIYEQAQRDGWTDSLTERFHELEQESQNIAREYGIREPGAINPDDYEAVKIDITKMHILEWHIGQSTDKICPKCKMPMILRTQTATRLDSLPVFFWGCTGFFLPKQCRYTLPVTNSDMGAFIRKDNEAFAMKRDEIIDFVSDEQHKKIIGQDLNDLKLKSFSAYRCPVHGKAMVLKRKRHPVGPLDVWYLKCPSLIISSNGWTECSQMIKIKSVAQVLAIRELGTGEKFNEIRSITTQSFS